MAGTFVRARGNGLVVSMLAAAVSLLIQRANSKRLDWTLDRRSQEARYLTQKQK